jgi:hypothetical protein
VRAYSRTEGGRPVADGTSGIFSFPPLGYRLRPQDLALNTLKDPSSFEYTEDQIPNAGLECRGEGTADDFVDPPASFDEVSDEAAKSHEVGNDHVNSWLVNSKNTFLDFEDDALYDDALPDESPALQGRVEGVADSSEALTTLCENDAQQQPHQDIQDFDQRNGLTGRNSQWYDPSWSLSNDFFAIPIPAVHTGSWGDLKAFGSEAQVASRILGCLAKLIMLNEYRRSREAVFGLEGLCFG